jgi:hypothetical protein
VIGYVSVVRTKLFPNYYFHVLLARYIWNVACYAFGFKNRPTSIQHLFGSWLLKFRKKDKHMAVGGYCGGSMGFMEDAK